MRATPIDFAERFYGLGVDRFLRGPAYTHDEPSVMLNRPAFVAKPPAYAQEIYTENTIPNFREVDRSYEEKYEASSIPISSTPAPETEHILQTEVPEWRMDKYNPDVDRTLIEHTLSELFPDSALKNEPVDVDPVDNWVESVTDNVFTISETPGSVYELPNESSSDTTPTNQVEAYAPDNIQDASSYAAESPAVEKYLDDILMDEAIDDAVLEAIADIFPVADDMVRREPDEPIKAEIFPPGF